MLNYENWEQVKKQADAAISQAQISLIINTHIAAMAEKEMKKYPDHSKDKTKNEFKEVK